MTRQAADGISQGQDAELNMDKSLAEGVREMASEKESTNSAQHTRRAIWLLFHAPFFRLNRIDSSVTPSCCFFLLQYSASQSHQPDVDLRRPVPVLQGRSPLHLGLKASLSTAPSTFDVRGHLRA